MNYTQFIELMRRTNQGRFVQRHHITPLSLGGTDDMTNIIYLSWSNHYIAHMLLAKENPAAEKCFRNMGTLDSWYKTCYMLINKNPMTQERRDRISESKKGQLKNSKWYNNGIRNVRAYECPDGFVEGRLITETHRQKLHGKRGTHHPYSEEVKKRMSESRKGSGNPMYGKHWKIVDGARIYY